MDAFSFRLPTVVVQGAGLLDGMDRRCASIGTRPFIVTGKRSARENGSLDRILTRFPNAEVFDGVDEDPRTAVCDTGGERIRATACDFVIGLGGGSAIDAAKVIAILATNPGTTPDYFGTESFTEPALPLVAIPTTSGAGSETTPYAVLVNETENAKRTVRGESLFPRIALLEPELTLTLPHHTTLYTGLDALSQGMEGVVSKHATPMSDVWGYEVCRIVRRWLPVAADEPENVAARAWMQYAAMLSGCVIAQTGTTLVHGLGYSYTTHGGVTHGLANALLLAPLFEFNATLVPEKVARIAEALGVAADPDPESAREAIRRAVYTFLVELNVSPAARDAGIAESDLDDYAAAVHSDASRFRNQRGEVSLDQVRAFYAQSFHGA